MISVPQAQLRKAAMFASSVMHKNPRIPVLSSLKVAANGALELEGTDLDTCARASLPYEGDEGEFLIPEPRKVLSAIRSAGGDEVTFTPDDKVLKVAVGSLSASLTSAIPADDFPSTGYVVEETFGAAIGSDFFAMLNRVRPAISTEETRYYLNGIFAHKIGDWLYRFVATDGHRLFIADVPLPDATGEFDGAIIPRRLIEHAIANFAKAKDGARFTMGRTAKSNRKDKTLADSPSATRAGFAAKIDGIAMSLSTKLIDGTYPDYTRVLPAETKHSITLKRTDLVQAINSLTPLSTDKTRAVRLTPEKNSLVLELHSLDIGKSKFPVPAQHDVPKGTVIGLNGRYLLDAINAYSGDEIVISLNSDSEPLIITDPADTAFKVVQMPMRV